LSTDFVAFAHICFDEAGAIAGSEGVVQQGQRRRRDDAMTAAAAMLARGKKAFG